MIVSVRLRFKSIVERYICQLKGLVFLSGNRSELQETKRDGLANFDSHQPSALTYRIILR